MAHVTVENTAGKRRDAPMGSGLFGTDVFEPASSDNREAYATAVNKYREETALATAEKAAEEEMAGDQTTKAMYTATVSSNTEVLIAKTPGGKDVIVPISENADGNVEVDILGKTGPGNYKIRANNVRVTGGNVLVGFIPKTAIQGALIAKGDSPTGDRRVAST